MVAKLTLGFRILGFVHKASPRFIWTTTVIYWTLDVGSIITTRKKTRAHIVLDKI
jgi:hypothetical protein